MRRLFGIFSRVFIATIVGFILLLQLPSTQSWLGSILANTLQEEIDSKVQIGRLDYGFPNRIIIDDLLIYDKAGKEMLKATRASAKISIKELMQNKISFSLVQLFSFKGNFYKKDSLSQANYQFVLDALASNDDDTEQTPLRFNSLILRHGSISWDQLDQPHSSKFTTSHLDISDISLHAIVKEFSSDSLNVTIKKLSAKEKSGLQIKKLSMYAVCNRYRGAIKDFSLSLPHSDIVIPDISAKYKMPETGIDFKDIQYYCKIDRSRITPSDLSPLLPDLSPFTNGVNINAILEGTEDRISINDFALDTDFTGINTASVIQHLGKTSLKGNAFVGKLAQDLSIKISTSVGSTDINAEHKGDSYRCNVSTTGINLKELLQQDDMGMLVADLSADGSTKGNDITSANIKGKIDEITLNAYKYNNIDLSLQYVKDCIKGALNITDPNIDLSIEGTASKRDNNYNAKVNSDIRRVLPEMLNLTKFFGNASLEGNISLDAKGSSIDDVEGILSVKDFTLRNKDGINTIDAINIEAGTMDDERFISFGSDFASAYIHGKFKTSTLINSITNHLAEELPGISGIPRYVKTNNIYSAKIHVTDTEWLNRLAKTNISLLEPLDIDAYVNDYELICKCDINAPAFRIDDNEFINLNMKVDTPEDYLTYSASVSTLSNGHKTDYMADAHIDDNAIRNVISWTNHRIKHSGGELVSEISLTNNPLFGNEINIDIQPSYLIMDNSQWDVMPSSAKYIKDRIEINNFVASRGSQHIIANGVISKEYNDSLVVDLNGIDVEYVMNLVNFHSVEFAGKASGKAIAHSLFAEPVAKANLQVDEFQFEHGNLGTLFANAQWNNELKRIDIDAKAEEVGTDHRILINGYVDPSSPGAIDLNLGVNKANLDFIESFCGSFLKNPDGRGTGDLRIHGPLDCIQLTGELVADISADVIPLNTRYTLTNDTIRCYPDEIEFINCGFKDKLGNDGILTGFIHHKHLTRLTYDLDVEAHNLLAYDFKDFGTETFCGTVFASGKVGIHGRSAMVTIDCDVTPGPGTIFKYNASSPDAVRNQKFITWNDVTIYPVVDIPENVIEIEKEEEEEEEGHLIDTNIYLNFFIHATPDATLKLIMDQRTGDYIDLHGTGDLRASFYNKGAFNLYGLYTVQNGIYKLTIQDFITKEFKFLPEGKIMFSGDPYDGDLNLQASYTVNGVSLSDLNIGRSFSNSTIRVNCLMNITGQPKAPLVDFDMDLPTVNAEERQMIRAFINSQNDMNQQVVYLLGIGRFYTQAESNQSVEQTNQQTQASLAMNSFLSGTISGQINSILSNVVKNRDWNFGANISTGTEGWNNAEYEGIINGALFNNRLLINGQFGYRDNANTATSSFIGDFDVRYLLTPNGNVSVRVYNQANDRYFTRSSLNTQGLGLILKRDFSGWKDLWKHR